MKCKQGRVGPNQLNINGTKQNAKKSVQLNFIFERAFICHRTKACSRTCKRGTSCCTCRDKRIFHIAYHPPEANNYPPTTRVRQDYVRYAVTAITTYRTFSTLQYFSNYYDTTHRLQYGNCYYYNNNHYFLIFLPLNTLQSTGLLILQSSRMCTQHSNQIHGMHE